MNELIEVIKSLTIEIKRYKNRLLAPNAHKRYIQSEKEYIQDKPYDDRILAEDLGRFHLAISKSRWYHKHRAKS